MTVLVVGNAAVDTAFEVTRLPRPGESILASALKESFGGKGLNQAVAAARAGAPVTLCAAVGSDWAATAIEQCLLEEGIDVRSLLKGPGTSDRSTVCVMPGGENAIVTSTVQARSLPAGHAGKTVALLSRDDVLLMQGNLTGPTTLACARRARQQGARFVINPSPIGFDVTPLWPLVDIVVLNEAECRELSGQADLEAGAGQLIAWGAGSAVVTRGARGALIIDHGESLSIPAPRADAVDTTGAGDLFCGVVAAGLSSDLGLAEACRWAIAAAAIAVTRRGASAAFPTVAELRACRPL